MSLKENEPSKIIERGRLSPADLKNGVEALKASLSKYEWRFNFSHGYMADVAIGT